MDAFLRDLRFAFRIFQKEPGLSLLAVLALSVSLGMAITSFSLLNGLFLKPPPFPNANQLREVYLHDKANPDTYLPLSYQNLQNLRQLPAVDKAHGYYSGTINLSGPSLPERHDGGFITPGLLRFLGQPTLIGEDFSGYDPTDPVCMIRASVWRDHFQADPHILGTTLRLNGHPHRIVGVLPDSFRFPNEASVWVPLSRSRFPGSADEEMAVVSMARLQPGISIERFNQNLANAFKNWQERSAPEQNALYIKSHPFGRVLLGTGDHSLIAATFFVVLLILLVSCANVTNLLIGRALTRGREIAIRAAVGASRRRLLAQLLTESFALALLGAVGGLLVAAWCVDLATAHKIWSLPYWISFEFDARVFLFAAFLTLLTTLIAGLLPAWQASRTHLQEILKDAASTTSSSFRIGRFTRILTVAQIAFACALLFAAGMIVRNLLDMTRLDPGYPPEQILTLRMGLFPDDYPTEQDRDAFFASLLQSVRTIEGVRSASLTDWLSVMGNFQIPFLMEPAPDTTAGNESDPTIHYAYGEAVSSSHFTTMGIRLLEGRLFNDTDSANAPPVAVVNTDFARRYFPDRSPVGQTVSLLVGQSVSLLSRTKDNDTSSAAKTVRIIGLVSSVRVSNFTRPNEPEPLLYLPYTQRPSPFMTLAFHTSLPPDQLEEAVLRKIQPLDPHLPVYFNKSLREFIDGLHAPYRILGVFLFTIGGMALFLAAVGVYGMIAFTVSRRRRELGIRMALGATSRDVVFHVVRGGLPQVGFGILLGTVLAVAIGRIMTGFLFGIKPFEPAIYLGVLAILSGVAIVAFFAPARRAARLSPLAALRYE